MVTVSKVRRAPLYMCDFCRDQYWLHDGEIRLDSGRNLIFLCNDCIVRDMAEDEGRLVGEEPIHA